MKFLIQVYASLREISRSRKSRRDHRIGTRGFPLLASQIRKTEDDRETRRWNTIIQFADLSIQERDRSRKLARSVLKFARSHVIRISTDAFKRNRFKKRWIACIAKRKADPVDLEIHVRTRATLGHQDGDLNLAARAHALSSGVVYYFRRDLRIVARVKRFIDQSFSHAGKTVFCSLELSGWPVKPSS